MTDQIENTPHPPELAQLRTILYGDFERQTDAELANLQAKIASVQATLTQSLSDQSNLQSNQLEANTQSLQDKIDDLGRKLDAEISGLRDAIDKRLDDMEERMMNRHVLSKLLKEISGTIGE